MHQLRTENERLGRAVIVKEWADGQLLRSDTDNERQLLQMLDSVLPRGRQELNWSACDVEYLGMTEDVDTAEVTLRFRAIEKAVLW